MNAKRLLVVILGISIQSLTTLADTSPEPTSVFKCIVSDSSAGEDDTKRVMVNTYGSTSPFGGHEVEADFGKNRKLEIGWIGKPEARYSINVITTQDGKQMSSNRATIRGYPITDLSLSFEDTLGRVIVTCSGWEFNTPESKEFRK